MNRPTISAVIITHNEENWIEGCIRCLNWVDEVLVLDGESTDKTVEVAKKFTRNVYSHKFDNFQDQKNRLLRHVKTDWIISIDADERSTPDFGKAVLKAISNPGDFVAFEVLTSDVFLGKRMYYGGWYPQYHSRVLKMNNF